MDNKVIIYKIKIKINRAEEDWTQLKLWNWAEAFSEKVHNKNDMKIMRERLKNRGIKFNLIKAIYKKPIDYHT